MINVDLYYLRWLKETYGEHSLRTKRLIKWQKINKLSKKDQWVSNWSLFILSIFFLSKDQIVIYYYKIQNNESSRIKGILSTTIVIFSYPKLLWFSVLTFIKWRLTPSYAAKDTIFWQKIPKTIIIGIIVQDNKNSNLFIWLSMWTRLEHAHCLETINNMWFLGKRESVNAWKKADFDGFREKDE
jgi:hypothetical protein